MPDAPPLTDLLQALARGERLDHDQTRRAFEVVMSGEAVPEQVAALLGMLQALGPTDEQIAAAALVMRERVTPVAVPEGLIAIDTCGTGGDHGGTFNVSTAAALVAAGAGRPHDVVVAKHGNRSVTSRSGSSQVLEALGVRLEASPETLTRCLDEAGICFCFAPAHHPAMKHVVPVRKALGIRTIFNVLGPLTNPAGARRQVIGVFEPALVGMIAGVLARLESERAMVVCGENRSGGILDEITVTGPTRIAELADGRVRERTIEPADLGFQESDPATLAAESPDQSARIIREVLAGEPGPARDIVTLNAGAALVVAGLDDNLTDGVARARDAIDSGAAAGALEKLVATTRPSRNQ